MEIVSLIHECGPWTECQRTPPCLGEDCNQGCDRLFTEIGEMSGPPWVAHTYQVKTNLAKLQATLSEMRATSANLSVPREDKSIKEL